MQFLSDLVKVFKEHNLTITSKYDRVGIIDNDENVVIWFDNDNNICLPMNECNDVGRLIIGLMIDNKVHLTTKFSNQYNLFKGVVFSSNDGSFIITTDNTIEIVL